MTSSSPTPTSEAITRVVDFFEHLQPADLAQLGQFYARNARFKDPFNEVQGLAAIEGIFRHMFAALEHPRFVITGRVEQGPQCFLTWEFRFAFRSYAQGVEQTIHGATHLVLDDAPHHAAPRLLGRGRGAVRKAAGPARADALAEKARQPVTRPLSFRSHLGV